MTKFLSLDWFKNKIEQSIDKQIAKRLDSLMEQDVDVDEAVRPYKLLKMVNSVLTVVLNDGTMLSKSNAKEEDYIKVQNATNVESIISAVGISEVIQEKIAYEKEVKKNEEVLKGIEILKTNPDFIVEGDVVRFKETSRSIPPLLVEKFSQVLYRCSEEGVDYNNNVEYNSLKRFFLWCCLNPRVEVANELYEFLTRNSFRITKQGFFVALRNVVTLHGSPEIVHFVSNAYNKIKAVWKKNPNEYSVFLENGEYKLIHNDKLYREETFTSTLCPDCDGEGVVYDYDENDDVWCETCDGKGEVDEYEYTDVINVNHGQLIGNLVDLYLDLPNRKENRFTDDWTKTFDIRIGKVVNMPMEECNWSTQDCAAAGLHFTANEIHYVGCGDQSVLILINPMKVVGIGSAKGRCYEYLPIMTVPREEATSILHDISFDTLELDEDFTIRELENLVDKTKEGFTAETAKNQFNLPNISSKEIHNIVKSLDDMKNTIQNRVVNLD